LEDALEVGLLVASNFAWGAWWWSRSYYSLPLGKAIGAFLFVGIASNAFMGSRTWEALLARWALGLCLVVFVGIAVLRCGWWSLGIICYWYWSTGCGEAIAKCIWDEPQLQQYRTGGLQILKGVLFGQKKAWCDREGVFIYVEDNRA